MILFLTKIPLRNSEWHLVMTQKEAPDDLLGTSLEIQ